MFEVLGITIYPLALILATVVSIGVGMLWYSELLFGKQWKKLVGLKKKDAQMKTLDMVLSFVSSLLLAFGLNKILQYAHVVSDLKPSVNVVLTSMMVAIFFTATSMYNRVLWEGSSRKLFLINLGHRFVTYLLMCGVMIWWIA
jgi:hypothetical protein